MLFSEAWTIGVGTLCIDMDAYSLRLIIILWALLWGRWMASTMLYQCHT